jgi:hypothetical protein
MMAGRSMGRFSSLSSVLVLLVVMAAGCTSTVRVQQQIATMMRVGDYPGALDIVEEHRENAFKGKNSLLYYFERGMLLHLDGRYSESNAAFEQAKLIGDRLYTESVSDIGFSLFSNDYALDYAGENFERTLVHLFSALNYLMLREPDAALVEIRQVGDYLRKLQVDSTNENVYQDDAFARYLSALVYESSGELDSAFVGYKQAASAYGEYETEYSVGRPDSLLSNAQRVASRLGAWAEEDLDDLGAGSPPRFLPEGAGEVLVLHFNGLSPMKDQTKFTIPFSSAWPLVLALQASTESEDRAQLDRAVAFASTISGVDIVSVAFPIFVDRPYAITRMRPRASAALEISSAELVEDIGAIAEKDLADRIVRIRTKAIARAAIKYALQKGVEYAARESSQEYGAMLSLATQITGNIVRYATEQADKRMWSTLPDKIWMSSLVFPAGTHDLSIDFLNAQGVTVESQVIPAVQVRPGHRQFVIVRTAR